MTTTVDTDWNAPVAHPVVTAVERIHAELDALAETPVWSLDDGQTRAALEQLTRLTARVAALELRVVAHADRVGAGEAVGATTTGAWWAVATQQTRPAAHRKVRLAAALDGAHETVRDAMAEGRVLPDQAQVIVDAVDALPTHALDPEVVQQARHHLISAAREHDARALKILGRRILEVVAPDLADAHEARLLEAEEAAARAAARFTMSEDGHGQVHGRFTLPALHGAMLRTQLDALLHAQDSDSQQTPLPHRRGLALAEWVERCPLDRLPTTGGGAATVVVTLDLDTLLTGLGSAALSTGGVISASEARRLACRAGIIPAVLDGASQVLDLGRRRRFHTPPQRIALALRDRGCTAAGCDRPPSACHAHHDTPWSHGGHTSLTNGRLLCPRHHTRVHDPAYHHTIRPDNKITFHRRT